MGKLGVRPTAEVIRRNGFWARTFTQGLIHRGAIAPQKPTKINLKTTFAIKGHFVVHCLIESKWYRNDRVLQMIA